MDTPDHVPSESCTIEPIAAWIARTEQKRLDLSLRYTDPLYSTLRDQTFRQISDLVQESIEKVRMISDPLQDIRETLRARSTRLWERSTPLLERSVRARAHCVQQGPSAEEIRAAGQPMLEMFKDSLRQAVSGPRALRTRDIRAS